MFETKSIRETCVQLDSDIDKGLTEKEAARRYEENGKNELKEPRKKTVVESFLAVSYTHLLAGTGGPGFLMGGFSGM